MFLLFKVLFTVIQIFEYAIVAHALLSWLPNLRQSKFYQALTKLISPIMTPISRVLPTFGGIDFSPIVAILLLQAAKYGLVGLLRTLMY